MLLAKKIFFLRKIQFLEIYLCHLCPLRHLKRRKDSEGPCPGGQEPSIDRPGLGGPNSHGEGGPV